MKKNNLRKLVVVALLIALNVVFSRLVSISAWNFKISFTFTTGLIAGYLYGPLYSMIVYGLGDLVGSLLFPIGAYNPLFTVTALVSGLIYGLFLHNNLDSKRITFAVLLNQLGCSLLLNTLFISIVYNASYIHLLSTRIIQSVIMLIIEFLTITAIKPFLVKLKGRVGNE